MPGRAGLIPKTYVDKPKRPSAQHKNRTLTLYQNERPNGGARGIRTPDLLIANETRYQLRHSPKDGYTLAPSEVSTQADREQQVIAPRTPQRRRDIEDDPDQDDPFPSATKGPLPSVTKGATKEPRREPGGSRRGSPIGPGARPGRHPGQGQRPDRRRPLRSSERQPGRSVRWGARESPP